jgi:protein-disulfide isomerase
MELTEPVTEGDHSQGKKDAAVNLVEYGDFECPNCLEAYPILKKLQKIEGSKMKFIFRNFPLSQIHPHALHAAYAAESAAKQGKFWEIHDLIFENQQNLEDQNLLFYAKKLNLDIGQFRKDMGSAETRKKVEDDFMSGVRSGVNGTPTIFINGTRLNKPCELEFLQKAIAVSYKGGDINE